MIEGSYYNIIKAICFIYLGGTIGFGVLGFRVSGWRVLGFRATIMSNGFVHLSEED